VGWRQLGPKKNLTSCPGLVDHYTAALLELPDKYAVIKAQIPTALAMLVVNIVLLYVLM
jgi:uncharacterized membrane protein